MTDSFDPTRTATAAEEIDVDFSGTSDDFVPLEDGWYQFAVESASARADDGGPLLSQKGSPMIKWVFRVVEGERANTPMYLYTVTTGPGAFSLRRFINRAFGQNLGREPMKLSLGPFIGKKFFGQVGPQKGSPEYKELKDYRPENQPPQAAGNGAPVGIASKI